MSVELLNRALRPSSIAALIAVGVIFLLGLGSILLYRYAAFGEIDWQGLTAFLLGVIVPYLQHAQNRHDLYKTGRIEAARPLAETPGVGPHEAALA